MWASPPSSIIWWGKRSASCPERRRPPGTASCILTRTDAQYVFVDTPGFQTRFSNALNRAMNRGVTQTLADVDVVFFVIEAGRFDAKDEASCGSCQTMCR